VDESDVMTLSGRLADRDSLDVSDWCPIERALGLIGTHSAFVLLREAFWGARRFDDLARRAGVTEQIAAKRLKQLVDAGVMAKRPYREAGQRTRYEYVLTDLGRSLFPVLVGLVDFGRRLQGETGRLEFVHGDGCGAEVVAQVQCADGHVVPLTDAQARIAPRKIASEKTS
jgi:DNA-binding HxlR family transcriptional regulator